MRAVIRTTTVLVLVLTLGLHWALLQTVAWTGMIISYSQDASLATAIRETFDGEHPCPLCKAIKQGRAEERKQEQQKPDNRLKLEFALPDDNRIFIAPLPLEAFPTSAAFPPSFRVKPLTPPPRGATV